MRRNEKETSYLFRSILLVLSASALALLVILFFKLKGGVQGIIVGAITVAVLIYWLIEINKIFRENKKAPSPSGHELFYDFFEDEEGITILVRMPGQFNEVEVKVSGENLEIKGDGKLLQRLQIPREVKLKEKSYVKGVLRIRLQKAAKSDRKISAYKV
jgi:HSP20 family molecular chaperone IbpA